MTADTNVKCGNKGGTFVDMGRMDALMSQIDGCDGKDDVSIADLIPKSAGPFSEIPVRTAVNATEHFGGMKMDGVRGPGDVICRTEDMQHVYTEILENQMIHVRDILSLAAEDPDKIRVECSSYLIGRFLDLYEQPVPEGMDHASYELDIPEPQEPYRRDGMAAFEYQGRSMAWAKGTELSRLGWESQYLTEKQNGYAGMYWDPDTDAREKAYAEEMFRVYGGEKNYLD